MDEAKALIKSNQIKNKVNKKFRCGSIRHLQITLRDFPVGVSFQKVNMLALDMGLSQYKGKKAGEGAEV